MFKQLEIIHILIEKRLINRLIMELDLSEYDQVDDTKLMLENHENMYCDGSSSKFLVTISSCSTDQASVEDANCENDFVFLPAPTKPFVLQRETQPSQTSFNSAIVTSTGNAPISATLTTATATTTVTTTTTTTSTESTPSQNANSTPITKQPESRTQQVSSSETQSQTHQQQVAYPLNVISTNSNNPFGNYKQDCSLVNHQQQVLQQQQQETSTRQLSNETCASKPIGLLEVLPAITNPNKLADLMQQIVTRSDLIFIAIPCAYCHEPVACPPSDISSWLNHMSKQHNCKVCPICTKMIGLGPRRDIEIMKRHVIEHLDEEWLERRASKVSFTFGLQQQWFSGNRCSVKDPRHR